MSHGRFDFDANQPEIIAGLENDKALVFRLDVFGCPCDLLVGWRRRFHILEVKNPATVSGINRRNPERSLTRAESALFALFPGFPIHIVFTLDEARRAIGIRR